MFTLAANVLLNYFLVVYPPIGQEGNFVVMDKYQSAGECETARNKFLEQDLTSRVKCIPLPRPSTSTSNS